MTGKPKHCLRSSGKIRVGPRAAFRGREGLLAGWADVVLAGRLGPEAGLAVQMGKLGLAFL